MFNTRQEFYEFGQSRGYSQEEIQEKEREYFDRGFSYRKENVIPFEPHKIVNTPMPNYTIVDETQASQQLKPNFEENHNKGVVHMYYDAKNQTPAQEVLDGSSRFVNEMRIRSDFDIPNDKPIQYFSVLEELKKQHSVAEDDMYYDSSTPATLSSLQSQLKGVFPDEEPPPDAFIEPEFAMRDLFFLSGERAFMRDAIEGSLDIDYDEAGNPIKGSGGVVGSTRYGTYNVGLSQRIMQNGIEGDREEIQKLINNDKIIREKIGGAYDYSDYDYLFSRRGFMTALQSAGMMAENAILGIGGAKATLFAGGAGGAAAVIAYNQQVGAGDMLLDYLYDEDVASMPDEEFEKAVQISNVIGVPFALIEQGVNIPMIKATGFGTTLLRPLKRKIIKKMMKKPELIKRVATGGVDAMYRIAVETIEEGGQEFVQEVGRQGMEDIDLEKTLLGNIKEIVEDADYKKATTQARDASIQALPAVIVMGGATTSVQATFDKNYLKEFTRDIQDARAGDELSVYRTAATKKLTNMGMPLELAEDLVDQAVYAETMQEVRDVIAKTQSALLEFNESFERVGLKTLTDQDWNSFAKFMSEAQLDEFIQMFPEIRDDFKAGVQGDVDARNRYNAFVKNNQDAQYLDFLVQQNQQSGQQQAPRTLSDKQKDEILNTNKHDAKFEERRLEGETLEETKLRYVYGIENMGDPFIRERIANVRKGLLRLMPNLQILVAENDNQYLELTKLEKPSAGVYQQGRIVLNLERVNKTTVAHEAFHALLDHYVSDKTFAGVINRIVDNVVKVADDSLLKRIELHRAKYSDYTEIDQKEEMVAELAGILSDSYDQLPSVRSGIRGLNDRLLSLVGIKTKSMADQEVIDMFNSVVRGFSEGVTVTEEQVSPVLGDISLETFKRQLEQRATTPKTVNEFLETIFGEPTSFLDAELVRINDKPVFLREVINSFTDADSQQFTYKELQQIAKALPFFNLRRNTTRQQLEEGIEDYGRNLENETIPVNSNYFDDNKFKDFIEKNEDELLDHYGDDYDSSYEGAYFYHLLDTADFIGKRRDSAKEQRDTDPDDLLDLLREIQGVGQSGQSYLNQTIDDYNEMRQKWDLGAFDPSMVMGFEEQTAEAVKQFGIVEDSNHPDFGNFNVDYFMQSVKALIYELKDGQKLPSLNSTEQAAVTLAISILDKRATQLTKEIEVADGEGRVNYTSRLIHERLDVVTQIERLSNLLIRARSDAARLLGSHRNNLREDYTLANILYRVAKITGTTETSEANVEYFSTRANELNEIEERKERLDTQLDSEYEQYYDEQVDDYFDYTYNTPAPEGILAKARKAVKEITTRAGKFFGKFGGKEQRISDARSSGGVLDTDNYVDRPEVLAARLAELFINDDVRDGKPLDKDSVLRRVKRVLEEDGHEFSMRDIKKAIAENTLKQYDLRKQYVAFLSLLKISATLEEDLSQAASKIFDADKKVRANGEDAIAMEATLDKLVAHFDALLNTVNTIYDKRMVKELRKRIETLRQLADDITAPKVSQKRKSKIVTKAQEELKLLQAKQRTKKRIAELQKIIDEGSYDAILLKRQKQASKYDQEMLDLMGRERRLKNEINKKIAMLEAQQENRFKRLLRDSMLLPRTLKAMADMSAAFNQAIMYLGKDPVGWMKTFTRGFGVFFNAKYADKMDGLTRALARDYGLDNYGIELTSTEGQINQKEEVFLTEFFNLPIIKQTIGKLIKDPSERHYVNFLNRMRVDMCVGFMNRHPDATSQEIMEWVEFVNLASGRGKINKKFDKALPFLGNLFFAPRLTASRFKLPYYSIGKIAKNIGKGRGVATEIASTWIGFGTTYGVMALLAVLNGWKIEDDPLESDYLKLRKGKLVLNPLGGFQQVARVHHLALLEGKALIKGEEMGFSEKPIVRMLKWKLNPIFSFGSEVGMNKDWVTNEELKDNQPLFGLDTRDIPVVSDSRFRAFIYNITPISIEGWAEGLDKQQEAGEIFSQLVPDFFGIGSSYYEKQKPKSKRKSRRSSNLLP